jgi:DNA-binding winged helix-turn-helix (wHTH) protein/TolB-like protein/Tfp pilus assembly protein PilF
MPDVRFSDFTLDHSRRQLLRGGEAIHLSPKAFQLLSILIQERPRAISKGDLQKQLWPDTFVTEGNLPGLVTELRTALGDDARDPRFIRTVYGFGYSFAAEFSDSSEPRRLTRWTTAAGAALLGAAGIILILSLRSTIGSSPPTSVAVRSIAVLPFDISGTDRAEQHLGLGLPDVLITRLSNVHHLVVRPTSAIRELAGHGVDSRQAGRHLNVDAVLEGSIRTSADRIRVTVQLLNVREQKPIWAGQFDEKRAEMFTIEDKISARVADALMLRLTPSEKTLLTKQYTADADAYQFYLQGRYYLQQGLEGRPDGRKSALQLFEKAVEKDPGYALAWAGLALGHAGLAVYNQASPRVHWPKAEAATLKALQLDHDLAEAHTAAGAVRMFWYLDFAAAEREFLRALEQNPRDILALRYYEHLLACTGRSEESIALRERVVELDPLSPAFQYELAAGYITARQYDRGIRQAFVTLGMDPNNVAAHVSLATVYTLRHDYEKAITHARKASELRGGRPQPVLGYALGMAGRRTEANEVLENLKQREDVTPFGIAIVYLGLGNRDAVFPLLQKGIDERSYALRLKVEPMFDPIRSDPRFAALLRHAGLRID